MGPMKDIVYRKVHGRSLHVDVYPAERPGPVVAYFHGGGWAGGSRKDRASARAVRLSELGVTVASFEYRFVDEAVFPGQLEDAVAAVAWLKDWAGAQGLPNARIGAWGASAGGHLAALLGLPVALQGCTPVVDSVVSWFAPFDMEAGTRFTPLERQLLKPSREEALLDGAFNRADGLHELADPISNARTPAASFLIMSGDRDRLVAHGSSERMHNALTRAGASSTMVLVGGAGHEDPAFEHPAIIRMVAGHFLGTLVEHQ